MVEVGFTELGFGVLKITFDCYVGSVVAEWLAAMLRVVGSIPARCKYLCGQVVRGVKGEREGLCIAVGRLLS